MNTINWHLVFKTNYYTKETVETNLVYTPMSKDNIYCMSFDHTHPYQNEMVTHFLPNRPFYNEETVDFFFKREVEYIDRFKKYSWSPNYIEIDHNNRKIFFEWPGYSCNNIVMEQNKNSRENLNSYCIDWETQLLNIVNDIHSSEIYKVTLYPHCFFIQNGILKTFDFYGCADKSDYLLPLSRMQGILGVASKDRFNEVIDGKTVNFKILFRQALEKYSCWPSDKLKEFAKKIS